MIELGELIVTAFGLLLIVFAGWVSIRVELAKLQQRMISIEADHTAQRAAFERIANEMAGEIKEMRKEVQLLMVRLEQKEDKI